MLTMDDQSVVASETDGPPEGVAVVTVTNVAMVAVQRCAEPVIVSDTETLRDFVNRTPRRRRRDRRRDCRRHRSPRPVTARSAVSSGILLFRRTGDGGLI